MRYHLLKTVQPYYGDIETGKKNFEIRFNDRDFRPGDMLILREYLPAFKTYTGKYFIAQAAYILHGGVYGLASGYCIIALRFSNSRYMYRVNEMIEEGRIELLP